MFIFIDLEPAVQIRRWREEKKFISVPAHHSVMVQSAMDSDGFHLVVKDDKSPTGYREVFFSTGKMVEEREDGRLIIHFDETEERQEEIHWSPGQSSYRWVPIGDSYRVVRGEMTKVKETKVKEIKTDDRFGENAIRSVYKEKIPALKKFGRELVLKEIKILTVNEFGLRFGLV